MRADARAGRALADVSVGVVPIVWNNVDLAEGSRLVPAVAVLDEVARLGYDGCQFGRGFPRGAALRTALEGRGLRLAEVYVALPLPGRESEARELARDALQLLTESAGDVLVVALAAADAERDAWSARALSPDAPRLGAGDWRAIGSVLEDVGREAVAAGKQLALHPHTGTYLETPEELARALRATSEELVGLCLDTGHITVGGGDPVATIRELGTRVRHVHAKDVDPVVLEQLVRGEMRGFREAVRARIFTELGSGVLDLQGVLAELAAIEYDRWIMVEQDTTWLPPSEAAAIGRRVLAYAIRRLDVDLAA